MKRARLCSAGVFALAVLVAPAAPADPADDLAALLDAVGQRTPGMRVETRIAACQIVSLTRFGDAPMTLETRLALDLALDPLDWQTAATGEVPGLRADEIALSVSLSEEIAAELRAAAAEILEWKAQEEARLSRVHETSRGRLVDSPVLAADWAAFSRRAVARIEGGELGPFVAAFLTVIRSGEGAAAQITDFGLQVPPVVIVPRARADELRARFAALQQAICPR